MVESLDDIFHALSSEPRRVILGALAEGERTVGDLASPFDISLAAVSKHLKVLEGAGLIARGRDAQRRPCRLEPAPLKEALEWLERYRKSWEERLDGLGVYLRELQRKEKKHVRRKK